MRSRKNGWAEQEISLKAKAQSNTSAMLLVSNLSKNNSIIAYLEAGIRTQQHSTDWAANTRVLVWTNDKNSQRVLHKRYNTPLGLGSRLNCRWPWVRNGIANFYGSLKHKTRRWGQHSRFSRVGSRVPSSIVPFELDGNYGRTLHSPVPTLFYAVYNLLAWESAFILDNM